MFTSIKTERTEVNSAPEHRAHDNSDEDRYNSRGNPAASYTRYSSDLQDESSITDQQRKCNERASSEGDVICREFEFKDEAVSGTKLRRKGFDALMAAARQRKFKTVYLENLSRLARESVISMPTLKELVYVLDIRVISVDEGIDTRQENWEILATMLCLNNDQFIKQLAKYVLRGQEGTVLADLCVGDHCFGYTSEPIPGSEARRRGRNARPRKSYKIDRVAAAWVVQIFTWFVFDKQSLAWIARELTRQNAPKDHRSSRPGWYPKIVRTVLTNEKYIGWWIWGKNANRRNPLNGKIRQEPRSSNECNRWRRHRPQLRIISDELWDGAQALFQKLREKQQPRSRRGTFRGSLPGGNTYPRHLLQGLLLCEKCGTAFNAGGSGAGYMHCGNLAKGLCECRKTVRRDLAEKLIVQVVANRILEDPEWKDLVLAELLTSSHAEEERVPLERKTAEEELATKQQAIVGLLDLVERGQAPQDVDKRLVQRCAERDALIRKLEGLSRAEERGKTVPTLEWVAEKLTNLEKILRAGGPAAAYALRDLIGGKIVLTEIKRPGYHGNFLRGRFVLNVRQVIKAIATEKVEAVGVGADNSVDAGKEFVIDFVDPPRYESQIELVKELWDSGLRHHQIAAKVGCKLKAVTKILKRWFEMHGLPVPDFRQCRRKSGRWPALQRVETAEFVDQVKALRDKELPYRTIAQQLHCGQKRVAAALKQWDEVHDLSVRESMTAENGDECQAA